MTTSHRPSDVLSHRRQDAMPPVWQQDRLSWNARGWMQRMRPKVAGLRAERTSQGPSATILHQPSGIPPTPEPHRGERRASRRRRHQPSRSVNTRFESSMSSSESDSSLAYTLCTADRAGTIPAGVLTEPWSNFTAGFALAAWASADLARCFWEADSVSRTSHC